MIGIKEIPYYLRAYLGKHNKLSHKELTTGMIKMLDDKRAFVCGKIGGTELWNLRAHEFSYQKQLEPAYRQLCEWSGFFSDSGDVRADLEKFSDIMKNSISYMDYINRWQYEKEEYFVKKYCKNDVKDIDWFGVVYEDKPIGEILRGRKVLAVTPFSETVKKQYARRELIMSDEYLPEFELQTYRAVQTIAGNKDSRFKDWFEALDTMSREIAELDFDIALVGCGAYSLPLCAAIKRTGRSAIHMGGDLQLLFGIMGKRWEDDELIQSLKNEYWVYPGKEDIPKNSEQVEDGCYW